jgi:RNA-splicing ligase RtcB
MGASSYVLSGLDSSEALAFSSSCRGPLGGTPGAGRDVDAVVMATEQAGLAQRVARLEPLISIP